jgi:hypothetical protein
MYECRRTMRKVITFEIVRQGLTNPLMRTEAAKVAGECISTDIFKEKLTQIEEVNQAKPKPSHYTRHLAKGRIRRKGKTRQTTGKPTQ